MIPPVPLKTTLDRDEAWALDDIAQQVGVRRSHIMRAMLRYVLRTNVEGFLEWLADQEDKPVETPGDPTPLPTPAPVEGVVGPGHEARGRGETQ